MSETAAAYGYDSVDSGGVDRGDPFNGLQSEPIPLPDAVSVVVMAAQSKEMLTYLLRRREALIMELRALDRALGREQTIPERTR